MVFRYAQKSYFQLAYLNDNNYHLNNLITF
jgi:hypothetical protein